MKKNNRIWTMFFLIVAGITAGFLTFRVASDVIVYIDRWTESWVAGLESGNFLFLVFRWVTELGSKTFLFPFVAVMTIALWRVSRHWLPAVFFAAGSAAGGYLVTVIKFLVQRERPRILEAAEGVGYSFPSAHAMSSMIIYGMLIYFCSNYLKSGKMTLMVTVGLSLLILLVGFSRYVIRVHYMSDVLAGYAYGFLFLVMWIGLFEWVNGLVYKNKDTSPS